MKAAAANIIIKANACGSVVDGTAFWATMASSDCRLERHCHAGA